MSWNNENNPLSIGVPPRQGQELEHFYWFHLTSQIRSTPSWSANHQPRFPPSTTATNEPRRCKRRTGSFFSKSVVAAGKMALLRPLVCLCWSVSTTRIQHLLSFILSQFTFECFLGGFFTSWNQGSVFKAFHCLSRDFFYDAVWSLHKYATSYVTQSLSTQRLCVYWMCACMCERGWWGDVLVIFFFFFPHIVNHHHFFISFYL